MQKLISLAFATMSTTGNRNFHDEAVIRKILTETKTIALVGASPKPERPSHYVMQFLLTKGYTVFPVNPGLEGKELLGQLVYGSLAAIPDKIDMIDIFRNAEAVPAIVDEAISIGAKSIWMQLGVVNEAAAQTAKDAGMDVVMDACPKIEIPKLGLDGPASEL
jgi:predicted CoA-binding protein